MKRERISETMQHIDTKFVTEANEYAGTSKANRHTIWIRWSVAAACLCLIIVAVIAVPNHFGDNPNGDNDLVSVEQDGTIIVDFKATTDTSYSSPEPGEYFCFIEVNEARKEYAGKNMRYLLSFDLFKTNGESISEEELKAEYQRLADLGYKLYYVEDHWTYYGDNQKKYIPVVVGLFTDEELDNFQASEKYGYAFHFETNGDSSPIKIDEDNVVTDFDSILY